MNLLAAILVPTHQAGDTLGAVLRQRVPDHSWSQIRRLIASRRVRLNDELCLDPARRVHEGDRVEVLNRPVATRLPSDTLKIRYLDEHLVVVEKPAGLPTVRHPVERDWSQRRKALSPTLEDLVPKLIARVARPEHGGEGRGSAARPSKTQGVPPRRLRVVQRLDKETSGLVVFARTVAAERGLGRQFHAHTVSRRYLAVVPGDVMPQTIKTRLVRDRGDRRRGSTRDAGQGKEAITHLDVVERLSCSRERKRPDESGTHSPVHSPVACAPGYSVLSCRLETGRTHQIRIHLAELGHPICGEKVYNRGADGTVREDPSGAPRLALHASELGFVHPITGHALRWTMPWPQDLQEFVDRLRERTGH